MLLSRTTAKHGAHRAESTRQGAATDLIDGRYKTLGRGKGTSPGCKRWLAHDLRLNRPVLIEVRPASYGATPDAALRAHTELLGQAAAVLLDAGYWFGGPDRPVTYVVTPPPLPTLSTGAAGAGGRRWARRRVAQVA